MQRLLYKSLWTSYEKSSEKLGGNDYTEFTNLITTLYLDNMKRVRDDVEWFINKFDHKYADAPWKMRKIL